MGLSTDINLSMYLTQDVLSRYGADSVASLANTSEGASFKSSIVKELQATGALPPDSTDDTGATTTNGTTTTTSTGDTTTAGTTDDNQSTSSSDSLPAAQSNYYDFTTTDWQQSHPGYEELFAAMPGLAPFLGDHPTYGSMFVNGGDADWTRVVNAYLAQTAVESASSSTLDTTA